MESDRVCKYCGVQKPLEQFCKEKKSKSGYKTQCKDCRNAYRREFRRKKRENEELPPLRITPKKPKPVEKSPTKIVRPFKTESKEFVSKKVKKEITSLEERENFGIMYNDDPKDIKERYYYRIKKLVKDAGFEDCTITQKYLDDEYLHNVVITCVSKNKETHELLNMKAFHIFDCFDRALYLLEECWLDYKSSTTHHLLDDNFYDEGEYIRFKREQGFVSIKKNIIQEIIFAIIKPIDFNTHYNAKIYISEEAHYNTRLTYREYNDLTKVLNLKGESGSE